jgi:hypothetical protein
MHHQARSHALICERRKVVDKKYPHPYQKQGFFLATTADPRALEITLNAWQVFERVGKKEGNRAIAQAAVYCAVAPKSNAVYKAFNQAMSVAKEKEPRTDL